jgi:hypothetical protein
MWCSIGSEDADVLMRHLTTSRCVVLCGKTTNQHITFAESRALFSGSSPFLVAMHLCFAESLQNGLVNPKASATPERAASWLANLKPRVLAALAAARERARLACGLEPHPDTYVSEFLEFPGANSLLCLL